VQKADPDFGQAACISRLLFAFEVDGVLEGANVKLWVGVGCLAVNDRLERWFVSACIHWLRCILDVR
jgi:hypothetical protein